MSCKPSLSLIVFALTAVLTTRPAPASDIDALDWLAGCWAGDGVASHYEECWLHPAGGSMLGVNRTVSESPTAFEFLRIAPDGDGLAYFASPGGRPPVAFHLVESGDGLAVFSNPGHDFPQRIGYRLVGDTLRAKVEALEEGEWKGFEIVWQRSSLTH